jgi:hypothetical protein
MCFFMLQVSCYISVYMMLMYIYSRVAQLWNIDFYYMLCILLFLFQKILGRPWPSGKGRWLQTTCPSLLWVRILTWTLDSFMWGSYPASLRNVGGSTQVPVRAWNNAWKGTWGRPPPVKLECRDMTYTVSMWC